MNFLKKTEKKEESKYFVSAIDKFLEAFDRKHPVKSASQIKEAAKLARIFYLRDHVVEHSVGKIWEGF
jgi:hypothetical protein